jgi:hypothetical protein
MMTNKLFLIPILLIQFYSNAGIANDVIQKESLSVTEAYKAVPHRRTEYLKENSSQPTVVNTYLRALFETTDLALVERIRGGTGDYDKERYQNRIELFNAIKPPSGADAIHQLIVTAVNEQRQYFEGDMQDKNLVQSSHVKLIQAYQHLLREFPDNRLNQQAYFDHLCALDFI